MNIIYQKIDAHKYSIRTNNGKLIGELIMDVDGYFYFWPEDNNGAWASHHLRELANKLDELNKEWDKQVEKEIKL
jgi:hypothetical protein